MRLYNRFLLIMIILSLVTPTVILATSVSSEKTTKFRAYQNNKALMEFANYTVALDYAKRYANSHVEEIGSRKWLWDNFPRYQVYEKGLALPGGAFANLAQAKEFAQKGTYRSIRDLQASGWVWHNYPRYRIYQFDVTLPNWEFTTMQEAMKEAKKWANANIIDLQTNRWIWDNYAPKLKDSLKAGELNYQIFQGDTSQDSWKFAYLEDAIQEALKWANTTIVNVTNGQVVYENIKKYIVYQNENLLMEFVSFDESIAYAKKWGNSKVVLSDQMIWTNTPYYQVYFNDQVLGQFSTIPLALNFASQWKDVKITTLDQVTIWDNLRKLQILTWTGKAPTDTITTQAKNTMGVDIISPTFFELADATGTMTDYASIDTINQLKEQGFSVHPLVHNQFSSSLTTSFLNQPDSRRKFIATLIDRISQLGLPGVNIDFESMAGSNRTLFTTFMQELTEYAHQKNIIVSVDLPRGDMLWNNATAFEHEKLGQIVDFINIMAYDQFWSGSKSAGSVAQIPWVEIGIQDFLSYGIPRSKIMLGVPFYVRQWKLDQKGSLISNRAITMKEVKNMLQTKPITKEWDPQALQYKMTYVEDGFTYVLWIEDEASMKSRIELAKKYDLAGISAWRLGYDFPELWQMILQNK